MMVAVGFNPRFASPPFAVRRVATGRKSAPYLPFIKFDLVRLEQLAIFFLERFRAMMLALPLNVSNSRRQVRLTIGVHVAAFQQIININIDSGDPEKGFKSFDWWSTIRATTQGWSAAHTAPTFSSIAWDRWIIRNLYATGGDAGLFWDLTNKSGQGFTVLMEDCVSIGRAFGAGFGYQVVRPKEPVVFRRCLMLALDWWGDAGALGVGSYNTSPPQDPDVICEDCTLAAPDNAIQILFPSKFIRLKIKDCRLMALNFSQPHGTPLNGRHLHDCPDPRQVYVDFENGLLMGLKLFGNTNPKAKTSAGGDK